MTKLIKGALVVLSLWTTSALVTANEPDLKTVQAQAAKGSAKAEGELGTAYYFGKGVPRDLGKAALWFQKAGDAGDPKAMYNLGHMYLHGRGVPQDNKAASLWLRKSAEAGFAAGQLQVGLLYFFGDNDFKQDYAQAAKWLTLAARQEKAPEQAAPAANALGSIYEHSGGGADQKQKAFSWYKKGAELGNSRAQFNLGRTYEEGILTKRNTLQAYVWLKIAADRDDLLAGHLMPEYITSKVFTDAEIKKGDKLVKDYEDKHPVKLE